MHAQDGKKILLVAVAMNNGIFALARIKIAPYGNLVGNCRDMMPHDWKAGQGKAKEMKWEREKRKNCSRRSIKWLFFCQLPFANAPKLR